MKAHSLFLILMQLSIINSYSQTHNFSYKVGLSEISGSHFTTKTENYFTIDVDATGPLFFNVVHGLQYEFRPQNIKRLGLNGEIITHSHTFGTYISDTDPDLFFSTGGRFFHKFRHLTLSAGPSIHLGRHIKMLVGMDFSYNFRVGKQGYDWQSQSPNPDPADRRLGEMADAMYRHLKINPVAMNAFAALEIRFWRLGLEARIASPLTGNLLKEMEIDGYKWDTQYFIHNIYMVTAKFYLRKI